MTTEQKAKRFEELLTKAKQIYNKENDVLIIHTIEDLFPELKISEDEEIRKGLIQYFNDFNLDTFAGLDPKKILAWLEKQGKEKPFDYENANIQQKDFAPKSAMEAINEQKVDNANKVEPNDYSSIDPHFGKPIEQKPADKVEPKFHEGDWTVSKLDKEARQISEVHFDEYNSYYVVNGKSVNLEEYDRLHHLWTIDDARDGDVLHSPSHHLIWIYKDNEHYYACVNMNYATKNVATNGLIIIPNDACPATKNEQTILFARMKMDIRFMSRII